MAYGWPSASGSNYDGVNNGPYMDWSMNYANHVMDFFGVWRLDNGPGN